MCMLGEDFKKKGEQFSSNGTSSHVTDSEGDLRLLTSFGPSSFLTFNLI